MAKEWRMPLLVAKLDIRGAFDSLDRAAVGRFLLEGLQHRGVGCELKYLLSQLQPNRLSGGVPGGNQLDL